MSSCPDASAPLQESEPRQSPTVVSSSELDANQTPTTPTIRNDAHFCNETEGAIITRSQDSNSDITADDDFLDEAYAESSKSGYLTSLASDVRRGILENGRLYPSYGRHEYGMPVDEQELDRNDLQHAKFLLLLHDRLFLAPIPPSPTRILDVGTGTGIWAIDIGDMYPEAEVIGTDIAPVQPNWIPHNVQFFLEDAEDAWTFTPSSFSFVFGREITFAVRDWPNFISQAWTALKPGGWLELSATHPRTQCDDGSLDLTKSFLAQTASIYIEIAKAMGASLDAPYLWAEQMQAAGFVDVETHRIKMPLGPW